MSAKKKATSGIVLTTVVGLLALAGQQAISISGKYFEKKFVETNQKVDGNADEILAMLDNALVRIDSLEVKIKELRK